MNKQKVNEYIKKYTQNKTYQFLTAIVISIGILYGSWAYLIQKLHVKRASLEKRIKATNLENLKEEIKSLKVQKQELVKSFQEEQKNFKKLELVIYTTHYPIITNILDKINSYAFNIQNYTLDREMKRMDVEIEGSYQNLIRFIDFLGNIRATVIVKDYKITLSKENMMVIKLGIEVAPIKI